MKAKVLEKIIEKLEVELARQRTANAHSNRSAIQSAPTAEKQRDTTGLEAAYLAHGYAQHCMTLARQLDELKQMKLEDFSGQEIDLGALVEVELNGDIDRYLLLHCCGGLELDVEGETITVITPESPMGSALMGNIEAGFLALPSGAEGIILSVM